MEESKNKVLSGHYVSTPNSGVGDEPMTTVAIEGIKSRKETHPEELYISLLEWCISNYRIIYELDLKSLDDKGSIFTPISDTDYDWLEDELKTLHPDSGIFSTVGHEVSGTRLIKHDISMLSINKTKTADPIYEMLDKYEMLVGSLKLDGVAGSLIYENGVFQFAKTRGDGKEGKNITKHVSFIDIQRTFSDKDIKEVRGEFVMSKHSFEEYRIIRKKAGEDDPTDQRSAVAGILNPDRTSNHDYARFVDFVAYGDYTSNLSYTDEMRNLEKFFKVIRGYKIASKKDVDKLIKKYIDEVGTTEYLTDGLVFRINKKNHDRITPAKYYNHSIAWKVQAEQKPTKVLGIIENVGKTGVITRTAMLEPTKLSGVEVSKAHLKSLDFIKKHNVGIGAIVTLERSNEVIPDISAVVTPGEKFELPDTCPSCGTQLIVKGADQYCTNWKCPRRTINRLTHFCQTTGMKGISDKTIELMYKHLDVREVSDLFDLEYEDIMELPKHKKTKSLKIIKTIQDVSDIQLSTFLVSLAIEGVGVGAATKIADKYKSIAAINIDTLMDIEDIGETIRDNIAVNMEYIKSTRSKLEWVGVTVAHREIREVLKGITIVITGSLAKPRTQWEKEIKELGGTFGKSVTKSTTYLVCNTPSTKSKYRKAKEIGTKIITEDQLVEIINQLEMEE